MHSPGGVCVEGESDASVSDLIWGESSACAPPAAEDGADKDASVLLSASATKVQKAWRASAEQRSAADINDHSELALCFGSPSSVGSPSSPWLPADFGSGVSSLEIDV